MGTDTHWNLWGKAPSFLVCVCRVYALSLLDSGDLLCVFKHHRGADKETEFLCLTKITRWHLNAFNLFPAQAGGQRAALFILWCFVSGKHPKGNSTNQSFIVSVQCCSAAKWQQDNSAVSCAAAYFTSSFHSCEQKETTVIMLSIKGINAWILLLFPSFQTQIDPFLTLCNTNNKWKVHLMLIRFCLFCTL